MLNNSCLRMEWDSYNKKEVEEAKTLYIKARKEFRVITDLKDSPIACFNSNLEGFLIKEKELLDNQFSMRIVDETGDRRLIWDATDKKQIEEAAQKFNDYINKGWRAYSIGEKGNKKRRICKFDAPNEEVYFIDITASESMDKFINAASKEYANKPTPIESVEKLDKFIASFKKIEVLPRKYPG